MTKAKTTLAMLVLAILLFAFLSSSTMFMIAQAVSEENIVVQDIKDAYVDQIDPMANYSSLPKLIVRSAV